VYGSYSLLDVATGYELDGRGSIPVKGKRFFSSLQRPDRLRGPPSLLYNGYLGLFPRWLSDWGVKLTPHLHIVPR
jgi:hypothetical protein